MNGSLLKSDIISKIYKELLIFTPETTLEGNKLNSFSLSEAITSKFYTEFKGESLQNVCIEVQQIFSSLSEIQMSSSGSAMWGHEISNISYTSREAGEGVTPRILSSIQIDCVEDSASSSSWKNY